MAHAFVKALIEFACTEHADITSMSFSATLCDLRRQCYRLLHSPERRPCDAAKQLYFVIIREEGLMSRCGLECNKQYVEFICHSLHEELRRAGIDVGPVQDRLCTFDHKKLCTV